MKVGIIAANNIRYSPYIFFYTDLLDRSEIAYELIIPDRNRVEDPFPGKVHVLNWDPRQKTAVNYALYARAVTKVIRRQQYDALIVLTSVNAAYLGLWLKKHYAGRYLVDIRDYTHENIPPYFWLQTVAVRNSLMNVISSRRFTSFLPRADYHVCHNFTQPDSRTPEFSKASDPISIGYVGALSYADQCRALMDLVAADSRFRLDFYGTGPEEDALTEYAQTLNSNAIRFHGAYKPSEKAAILDRVDILFNAYGNGCPLLDCALSNKLYDALVYRKPILTCPGTFMTEMAGPLAFPMDLPSADSLEDLYRWYQSLEAAPLDDYARRTLNQICLENAQTHETILHRLKGLEKTAPKSNENPKGVDRH